MILLELEWHLKDPKVLCSRHKTFMVESDIAAEITSLC